MLHTELLYKDFPEPIFSSMLLANTYGLSYNDFLKLLSYNTFAICNLLVFKQSLHIDYITYIFVYFIWNSQWYG